MGCGGSTNSSQKFRGSKNVAIIGGGIAGLSAAYYISQRGIEVTVYEENSKLSAETSYGPAALTMWKQVSKALDKDGTTVLTAAKSVKGVANFVGGIVESMAWKVFSGKDYQRSGIMGQAQDNFRKFCSENEQGKALIHQDGLLYMLNEEYFNKNKKQYKNDPTMVFYTKSEFEKSEIYDKFFDNANYYGILLSKEEGYVDPQRLAEYLAQQIEKKGGKVHCGAKVDKITEAKDGKVTVYLENGSNAEFESCIVALGAFSGKFLDKCGFNDTMDEIFGVKGYSITGRMEKDSLRRGVVDCMDTKFFRPFYDKNGEFCIRAGGIADSFDPDDPYKINWDRMEEFKKNQLANKIFENNTYPDKENQERAVDSNFDATLEPGKIEVWSGVRPVNKDNRLPVVRQIKGTKKIACISGFGSNGFVMSWWAGPKAADMF